MNQSIWNGKLKLNSKMASDLEKAIVLQARYFVRLSKFCPLWSRTNDHPSWRDEIGRTSRTSDRYARQHAGLVGAQATLRS